MFLDLDDDEDVVVDLSDCDELDAEVPWVPADPPIPYDELDLCDGSVVIVVGMGDDEDKVMLTPEGYRGMIAHSQRLAIHAENALNTRDWWSAYQNSRQNCRWHASDDTQRDNDMDLVRALWTALDSFTDTCLHDYLRWEGRYNRYFDPWWDGEVRKALHSGAMYSLAYAQSMCDRLDVLTPFWGFNGTVEVDACMALFALIIAADTRLAPKLDIG